MTSRALERDIADFTTLLQAHFARMTEILRMRTRRLRKQEYERVASAALVLAFRSRDDFNPSAMSVIDWFDDCVQEARDSEVVASDDETLMLEALQPKPSVEVTAVWINETSREEAPERGKADPILKIGKDCPPCWKCRYFDGWLPRGTPADSPVANDGGVSEAIANLDRRKIEIANYVRGNYSEELLED
jgi:hypothetical protein